MKNIHILPTEKPSRLCIDNSCNELNYSEVEGLNSKHITNQNIYITSDEEIKEGWHFNNAIGLNNPVFVKSEYIKDLKDIYGEKPSHLEKIILTTDQDLINDGVQAIDYKFLEWFVHNPSCDFVEVERGYLGMWGFCKSSEIISKDKIHYKIIIPKEEAINCEYCGGDGVYITADSKRVECPACDKGKIPKEPKTLEEAAEELYPKTKNKVIDFANELRREGFLKCAKWQQERMYSLDEIKDAMKNGYGIKYFSEHKFLKNLNNLKNKKI